MLSHGIVACVFSIVNLIHFLVNATNPTGVPSGAPSPRPTYFYGGYGSGSAGGGTYYYGSSSYSGGTISPGITADTATYSGNNTCEANNKTNVYVCEQFQRDLLLIYTWNQQPTMNKYPATIPTKNGRTPFNVNVVVKYNDFNGADSIQGSINLGVEILLTWKNEFVNWDVTSGCFPVNQTATLPCPPYDVYEMSFEAFTMWIPDVQLYNDVVPFDQGFPSNIKAIVAANGQTTYVLTGQITYSCNFVMTDFPFDTQSCDAVFGSRSYFNDALNLNLAPFAVDYIANENDTTVPLYKDKGIILMDSFVHPEWKVNSVSTGSGTRRSVRKNSVTKSYGQFDLLVYTLKMKRYSSYYLYSCVGPTILVTIVAFFSLFINAVDSKMAIAITCLLTIMAVQWIVSTQIPITNDNPWIMRFCTACEGYVGFICIASFFISYIEEVEISYKEKYISVKGRTKNDSIHSEVDNDPTRKVVRRRSSGGGSVKSTEAIKMSFNIRQHSVMVHDTVSQQQDMENALPTDPDASERQSFFDRLKLFINPYEKKHLEEDEPMPFWLRFAIDIYRPIKVLKFLAGKAPMLFYVYHDASFAVNWTMRIFSLIALAVILIVFLTQVDLNN